MKRIIFLTVFFSFFLAGAQKKPQKKGAYRADVIHDEYVYDSVVQQYKPLNMRKPYLRYYFNREGQPLEKWHHGKYDTQTQRGDNDDYVYVYEYGSTGHLNSMAQWQEWRKKLHLKSFNKYVHDANGNLTERTIFENKTSYTRRNAYTFDDGGNIITANYDSGYRREWSYDSINRPEAWRDYDVKTGVLHMKGHYTYTDSTTIEHWCNNYAGKIIDSPIFIIKTFTADKQLGVYELKASGALGNTKKIYHYQEGALTIIEHYFYSTYHNSYVMYAKSKIKLKGRPGIEALKLINSTIIEEMD